MTNILKLANYSGSLTTLSYYEWVLL